MKKPTRKAVKGTPIKPKKTTPLPGTPSQNHKQQFEQLLDDAVLGVKKK